MVGFSSPALFAVLSVILLSLSATNSAADEIPEVSRYRVHVNGDGAAKYDEDVEVDRTEETGKFDVPAHGDIPAANYLFDFKKNLTMIRVDAKEICFLLKIDPRVARPTEMIAALDQMDETPDVEAQKSTSSWKYSDSLVDPATLFDEMVDMCGEYRIIRLEPGVVDPTDEVNETTDRVRRAFSGSWCQTGVAGVQACPRWKRRQCRKRQFATSVPIMKTPCQIVPAPASGIPVYTCQVVHQRFQITCCDPHCL